MAAKDDDHHDHGHHHDHDHEHGSELSEMQIRVRALETVLTEKGYVDPAALDLIIEAYETKIGPHNGARVVAKAWADPLSSARCSTTPPRRSRALGITEKPRRRSLVAWRTRRRCTTWSSARCAPAIRGKCSACRRSGTSRRPIARARSSTRAACCAISASRCRRRPKSASGIPPPRRATSCCRCGPPAPKAGARSGSPRWSRAIA